MIYNMIISFVVTAPIFVVLLSGAALAAPDPGAPRPSEAYWLKIYSTAPIREFWTGTLTLKDPDAALPKALKAIEAEGGRLTAPLADFAAAKDGSERQLSLGVPRRRAAALLKRLRKLGELPDPLARSAGAPIPLAEVKAKADRLIKEQATQAAALAKVPAAAAAAREILEHLLLVEEVAEKSEPQVVFNLTVRRR